MTEVYFNLDIRNLANSEQLEAIALDAALASLKADGINDAEAVWVDVIEAQNNGVRSPFEAIWSRAELAGLAAAFPEKDQQMAFSRNGGVAALEIR